MTRIYAIANQKGGVGKTTTVVNISAFLAAGGRRVLLVDIDPQSNATSALGYDKYAIEQSTYHLLLGEASAETVRLSHPDFGIDILPAHPSLAGAEIDLVGMVAREHRLGKGLSPIEDQYDYILIDCPPSLGLLTINALTAAQNGILIPVQCEYLPLEGLTQLMQTTEMVGEYLNPSLDIRGLIMTMYDSRTNLSRQVVEEVRQHFPDKVFRTIIPRNIRLTEAPSFGQPVGTYAPNSSGALAYRLLTAELVQGDRTAGGSND